jgi:uncharacterized membrane protein
MREFLIALGVFLAAHMLPAVPRIRGALTGLLGARTYLALYSALSLALLTWVVLAAQRADTIVLWEPAPWQRWVPLVLMPFAIVLVVAGLTQHNPLSVTLRSGSADAPPGSIVAVTRHPVLWGFLLWALAHIPPNGDLVALILFGGMALLAGAGMRLVDARTRRRVGAERWAALAATTSILPFSAVIARRTRLRVDRPLAIATIVAVALYLWLILSGHEWLMGIDPLIGLR